MIDRFRTWVDRTSCFLQLSCSLVITTIVLIIRKPQGLFASQLWAEDATLFFRDNLIEGSNALFHPYAGYLHLIPRLIARAGSIIPFEKLPLFYSISALIVFLAIAGFFLWNSDRNPLYLLFPIVSALVLHDGECFFSLTNIQWMIAPYFVFFCRRDYPQNLAGETADLAVLILMGLSGPFIIFCIPYFIYRAFIKSTFYGWLWTLTATGLAGIQAFFIQTTGSAQAKVAVGPTMGWLDFLAARFASHFILSTAVSDYLNPVILKCFVILFLFFFFYLIIKKSPHRLFRIALMGLAATEIVCTLVKYAGHWRSLTFFGGGERYFYFAYVLLSWLLLDVLRDKKSVAWAAGVILTMSVIAALSHFQAPTMADMRWPEYSRRLRTDDQFIIFVNPAGWGLRVDKKASDGNWLKAFMPGNDRQII